MNRHDSAPGTQRETLEVFNYTWPKSLQALAFSGALATAIPVMALIKPNVSAGFRLWLFGSWETPLDVAFTIYALAAIGICRLLSERLKRPRTRPSLVAERSGLTTQWSVRVPWNDIDSFSMGTVVVSSSGIRPPDQCPCAVVPNIGKYPRPWWMTRFTVLEPANAFPVIQESKAGYLVRRDGVDPLEHVGDQLLIAELSNFRARMKNDQPAPTVARARGT